jgi:hypothetical protein
MLRIPLALLATSLFAWTAFAATDDFRVQMLVGDDITPPSIPANLVAVPVATSQIDLSWNASTDNVAVTGYQVFRDNFQIATTTLLTYSDTGLTPSTTYAYYVTAFDGADNVSASSTVVATTTLATTTPPATTTPSSSGGAGEKIELVPLPLEIIQLEIIPGQTHAVLRYETRGYVRSTVRWGRTSSYELGSLVEQSFRKIHETRISGLSPGTLYRFTIEGENNVGVHGVLTENSFVTLPADDVLAPANVQDLRAVRDGDDIILTWKNPSDDDFSHVRILRNDRFYPTDTADGWITYEGSGEKVNDEGSAVPGTVQYYTAFSYDVRGNVSSGAIVALRITDEEGVVVDPVTDETNIIELTFEDISFVQDGGELQREGNMVFLDGTKQLTVSVSYERLPEHLKAILVTLTHPTEKSEIFSFLLRIDPKKDRYTATIAPLGENGVYPLTLSVIDFETAQIGYVKADLNAHIVHFEEERSSSSMWGTIFTSYFFRFILLLLILLTLAYRFVYANKRGRVV